MKATVNHPVLRTIAGFSSIFNFCFGILPTIFVLYAVRDRGCATRNPPRPGPDLPGGCALV